MFTELKRRNVLRMAALYIAAAWLCVEVAGALIDLSVLPGTMGPWVVVLLAIGFPIALIVSWFFDVTPEGVVRDSEVLKDVNPGQPIRFPVEKKGRFKPLSLKGWANEYLVAPVDFGGLEHEHMH